VGTVAWTGTLSDVAQSDNARASVTLTATQTSHYLLDAASTVRFNVPTGASIDGILLEVEVLAVVLSTQNLSARLVKGGTVQTAETKTALITTTDAYLSFGGSADTWSTSWTVSDVNATNFGSAIFIDNALADTYRVDHSRLTVYFTEGGAPQSITRTLLGFGR
jgi:hypothetical protein